VSVRIRSGGELAACGDGNAGRGNRDLRFVFKDQAPNFFVSFSATTTRSELSFAVQLSVYALPFGEFLGQLCGGLAAFS
jgi:hypothetical protein